MAGKRYERLRGLSEATLERIIKGQSENIFGKNSIYFEKSKISSVSGITRIPDGYVIVFSKKPAWYVIEVELSIHSVDHIRNQLDDFQLDLENEKTITNLVKFMRGEIRSNPEVERHIREEFGEVHEFLFNLIHERPTIIVIIDELTAKLREALGRMASNGVKCIEFEVFNDQSTGDNAYVFETIRNDFNPKMASSPADRSGYTGKRPTQITIAGHAYSVKTWRDVLYKTLELVRNQPSYDPKILLGMRGTKRAYFSRDPGELRVPVKIEWEDFYAEINLSANSILKLSERILEAFDLTSKIGVVSE